MQRQRHRRELRFTNARELRREADVESDLDVPTHRLRIEPQHRGDAFLGGAAHPQAQHLFHFDHRDLAIRHPLLLPALGAKPEE